MNRPGRGLRRAAAAGLASAVAAATLAGPALARTQAAAAGTGGEADRGPEQHHADELPGPGVPRPWRLCGLARIRASFDVQRASYTKPITLTQVIYRPGGGTTTRSLPASLLDGLNGLRTSCACRSPMPPARWWHRSGRCSASTKARSGLCRAARARTRTRPDAASTRSRRAWSWVCRGAGRPTRPASRPAFLPRPCGSPPGPTR